MKWFALLFICFINVSHRIGAQPASANRYAVELPEDWKGKPKLLFKLVDIIRTHIPQLENKRECLDCKANYYVRFFVSPPTVNYIFYHPTTSYQFTTMFHFYSYMDVSDTVGRILHRLVLNDTLTIHSSEFKLNGRGSYITPVQNSIAEIKDNLLPPLQNGQRQIDVDLKDRAEKVSVLAQQFDSDQFIKNNTKALTPTEKVLWSKVQDVIMNFKFENDK